MKNQWTMIKASQVSTSFWLDFNFSRSENSIFYGMAGWETMWSANGGLQPGQFFDALKPLPALVSLLQRNVESSFLGEKSNVLVPGCGR